MNETLNTILNRHSVRKYENKKVTDNDKKIIIDAISSAPSAANMQMYGVIEICDNNLINEISKICDNQAFIKDAGLILMFVSNPLRYYNAYNKFSEKTINPTKADLYLSMCDALIASENAVIAAESINIGSCYIGSVINNHKRVKELFKLPKYVNPVSLLVMGYKKDEEISSPKRFDSNDIYMVNEFKDDSISALKNKISSDDDEKVFRLCDALVRRKLAKPFYQEMIKSFDEILKEYEE